MDILKANAAHLKVIVTLNRVVQGLHAKEEPRRFRLFEEGAVTKFFQCALDDPAVTVLLAIDGDKPLGYALLRVQNRPEEAFSLPRSFVELEQIAVDPESRKRGVGSALIDEALAVADSLGPGDLELSVWDFNSDARRLFQRKGFTPCLHRMRARRAADKAVPSV